MADSRYLEAWKRNTPLPRKGTSSDAKAPSGPSYQVRLDTPGGVTYSPDQLSTHNQIKRLFVPYKVGERFGRSEDGDGEQREYDFDQDLQKLEERADSDNTGSMLSVPNSNGSDGNRISDAQAYAASIDMSTPATPSSANSSSQEKHSSIDDEEDETEPVEPSRYHDDRRSTSGKTTSGLSTKSTRSTKTADLLASNTGSLPSWYIRPSTRANVMPFTVPPSKSGRATDFQTPWAGMKWQTHRSFERPSHTEKERGIAAFDDVSGAGRAPQADERLDSDGKTVTRASTKAGATDSKHLLVADLFVIDPRPNRPLRMVRRTDPRQVLLLASGTMLNTSQIASQRAVLAAKDAGVDLSSLNLQDKDKAQKALEQFGSKGTSGQGGIGVLFSPHEEPLAQDLQGLDVDSRAEVNLCRRLEAPPTFVQTTIRRAQLRSVLAALELTRWEEEGFDKIVIGTDQEWILRGISNDIWRWKHTGWKLTEYGPQGAPGESVPDRDLWELLDEAVKSYENIDCNVRFWQVAHSDLMLANRLSEMGALKAKQRPELVRWRKKGFRDALEKEEKEKMRERMMSTMRCDQSQREEGSLY